MAEMSVILRVLTKGVDSLKGLSRDIESINKQFSEQTSRLKSLTNLQQYSDKELIRHHEEVRKILDEETQKVNILKNSWADLYGVDVEGADKRKRDIQEHLNLVEKEARHRAVMRGVTGAGAAVGVAATAGVGIAVYQWVQQEKIMANLAARIAPLNDQMSNFVQFTENLRQSLVEMGSTYAFSGPEILKLADAYSQLSGAMPSPAEIEPITALARAYGIAPTAAMAPEAIARRFAPTGGAFDMDRFGRQIAGSIEEYGMQPRAREVFDVLADRLQFYGQRMPEIDDASRTAMLGFFDMIQATGIPALRGTGALPVMQGFQSMLDSTDDAMEALKVQTVMGSKSLQAAAARQGFTNPYVAALALGEQGISTPAGQDLFRQMLKAQMDYFPKSLDMQALLLSKNADIPINTAMAIVKSKQFEQFVKGQGDLTSIVREFNERDRADAATHNIFLQGKRTEQSFINALTTAAKSPLVTRTVGPILERFQELFERHPLFTMGGAGLMAGGGGMAALGSLLGISGAVTAGAPIALAGAGLIGAGGLMEGARRVGEILPPGKGGIPGATRATMETVGFRAIQAVITHRIEFQEGGRLVHHSFEAAKEAMKEIVKDIIHQTGTGMGSGTPGIAQQLNPGFVQPTSPTQGIPLAS